MTRLGVRTALTVTVTGLMWMVACGGGNGGGPSGPGNPGSGNPGPIGATITFENGRINPASVTIAVGQSVNFLNNDGVVRNVSSDPHPVHTDCPGINAVGNLSNGQSRPTNALTTARVCGFHNHNDPENAAFKGTIDVR